MKDVPQYMDIDRKRQLTDVFMFGYLNKFLSTLLVVPVREGGRELSGSVAIANRALSQGRYITGKISIKSLVSC